MVRRAPIALLLVTVALLMAGGGAAQPSQPLGMNAEPPPAPEVTVTEQLGATIPRDIPLVNSAGEAVQIGDFLGQEQPVVLVFSYHSCPMLCSLILDGLARAVEETDLEAGADFAVVNVSFDARDTPAVAAEVKAKYVEQIGAAQPSIATHWHALTGTEADVRRLADEVGFGYAFVEETGEYAHNAALIFLSPEGTVTRYLYGLDHAPFDFKLALVEAGDGTVGSSLDRFLLTCFQYDATSRSYTPYILNIMKLGGALLLVALAAVLIPLWRRERRRQTTPDTLGPLAGLTD
ncbi:MAG: SCO family protein [Rhodothermaceae bacterium]|nr:SCO family protein [Rhodothermaceae bacterium]